MPPRAQAASGGFALVVGEAGYSGLPALAGCALSAHAVSAALRGLNFTVDEQDDPSSGALYAALGALKRQLAAQPDAPTFIYVCAYAMGYEGRPFLLPASASIGRPADVLTQGLLVKSLPDAMPASRSAAAVLALDVVPVPTSVSGEGGSGEGASLALDAAVPPTSPSTLGYLAAANTPQGNTPLALAATLVPLLHGSTIESSKLLSDAQQRLAGTKAATVAALRLPDAGLFLAGTVPPTAPVAATPPASPAAATTVLPDEDQMTEAQRRQVQHALARLGYYDAQTDGVFGPETRAAIRRWQHEQHAPMTGHLTAGEASKLATTWD
ncbi:peptidoglycan-binding protein [Aliidongia dinghuensis]|nr:peptidoglycan-binding protein [Aliidongia dinghuensis]